MYEFIEQEEVNDESETYALVYVRPGVQGDITKVSTFIVPEYIFCPKIKIRIEQGNKF